MTVFTKFCALGALWIIGGMVLMVLWASKILGDEAFLYIFAWAIVILLLNLLLLRCPYCGTSAYFVRRFVYVGWPKRTCRKCGAKM